MSTKRKSRAEKQASASLSPAKQQPARAGRVATNGATCIEDYIWSAMQGYGAGPRSGDKPKRHFA